VANEFTPTGAGCDLKRAGYWGNACCCCEAFDGLHQHKCSIWSLRAIWQSWYVLLR